MKCLPEDLENVHVLTMTPKEISHLYKFGQFIFKLWIVGGIY